MEMMEVMLLHKVASLRQVKDFHEMEYDIAEILESHDSIEIRTLIECVATVKMIDEGWGKEYKIPNINGLKRPLTRYEVEEIMREDMRSEW
jgi:hypothetical protein